MLVWLRKALIPGLWVLFGELVFKLLTGQPPPGWNDLPGYGEVLAGFLVGYGGVLWWKDRSAPKNPRG